MQYFNLNCTSCTKKSTVKYCATCIFTKNQNIKEVEKLTKNKRKRGKEKWKNLQDV